MTKFSAMSSGQFWT